MTFGEKLQTLRKREAMSQETLAEKLEITRQTVSKWELDQSTPELGYIAKISDLYNVSTDYLIKDDAELKEKNLSESNSTNDKTTEIKQSAAPKIALGVVLAIIGILGVLTLIICSFISPIDVIWGSKVFEGLLGFLIGSNTLVLFIFFIVLTIIGLSILVYPTLRTKTETNK